MILTRAAGRTGLPDNEALADLARHRTGLVLFLSAAQAGDFTDAGDGHESVAADRYEVRDHAGKGPLR